MFKHENASLKMFDYMRQENEKLKKAFEECGLDDDDVVFIKQLIHKTDDSVKDKPTRSKKSFLYEV